MTDLVYQLRGDPSDSLKQTAADEIERLRRRLRQKDEAMGVLFERLAKAGVDCSDLIS